MKFDGPVSLEDIGTGEIIGMMFVLIDVGQTY